MFVKPIPELTDNERQNMSRLTDSVPFSIMVPFVLTLKILSILIACELELNFCFHRKAGVWGDTRGMEL